MKKETLILLGLAGAGIYFYMRNKNKYSAPGKSVEDQQKILKQTFGKYLPTQKKALKPVIEALPLENLTKQQYQANKPKIIQKGLTIVKKLFAKKQMSGFDNCIGLY